MPKTKFLTQIQNYEHIIWDWNGTILDDVLLGVEVVSEMLRQHGLNGLSLEKYRELFSFPISDYYQKLGFDFKKVSYHELSEEFMKLYSAKAPKVKIFSEMRDLLSEVSQSKTQSILSALEQWHLETATEHHGIKHYFTHIFGLENYYAHSKLERGRELIKKSAIDPNKTLLIGDTDHDLEVGKSLGIDVLLTSDGHQSFERLSKTHNNVLSPGLRSSGAKINKN